MKKTIDLYVTRNSKTGKPFDYKNDNIVDEYPDIKVMVDIDVTYISEKEGHNGTIIKSVVGKDCPIYENNETDLFLKKGEPIELSPEEEELAFDKMYEQERDVCED